MKNEFQLKSLNSNLEETKPITIVPTPEISTTTFEQDIDDLIRAISEKEGFYPLITEVQKYLEKHRKRMDFLKIYVILYVSLIFPLAPQLTQNLPLLISYAVIGLPIYFSLEELQLKRLSVPEYNNESLSELRKTLIYRLSALYANAPNIDYEKIFRNKNITDHEILSMIDARLANKNIYINPSRRQMQKRIR